MSGIKRWVETLRYVPPYYRLFFLYLLVIILVILYSVFKPDIQGLFYVVAVVVYSGIILPFFLQSVVGKLSQRLGWWVATGLVLVGFYAVMKFLVSTDLLDRGLIYDVNIYGIIWTALIAGAGAASVVAQHGFSGLAENVRRDVMEISITRRMTKGEPLVLDRRTLVVLTVLVVFTGFIFVSRIYLYNRPDSVTAYSVPLRISEENSSTFYISLANEVNRGLTSYSVTYHGYFRYPAYSNYTGKDLLELARSIDVIRESLNRAKAAPADMISMIRIGAMATSIKELRIDLSEAFRYLGLYSNETAHLQIPSKFIVQWDTRRKRFRGVWVGTPGVPFMKWESGSTKDGRGLVESDDPYLDVIRGGMIELKEIAAGATYGFNLTGVYYPWLGEEFRDIDRFMIMGEASLDGGKTRTFSPVEISRKSPK